MQRFEAARHAQRFLSTHTRIHNHLQHRRRRLNATDYGIARDVAFRAWRGSDRWPPLCDASQGRARSHLSATNLTTPFHFHDGARTVWLPKSQVTWHPDDNVMVVPYWLAKDEELI